MSQTVQGALAAGLAALKGAGIDGAARDARLLMAGALQIEAGRLTLVMPEAIEPEAERSFMCHIERRAAREPVSHILGRRMFYGREFEVTPDVLDPRGDTETLIEVALEEPFERLLDLGTGSGCILLTLVAETGAQGLGTDMSEAALEVAQRNAAALGCAVAFMRSDWFAAVQGTYDLIVSNPPYIAASEMGGLEPELSYEPRMALTDEADGLSAYRVICAGADAHLARGGRLIVEIGATQSAAVAELMRAAGLQDVAVRADLDGRERVVLGRKAD